MISIDSGLASSPMRQGPFLNDSFFKQWSWWYFYIQKYIIIMAFPADNILLVYTIIQFISVVE